MKNDLDSVRKVMVESVKGNSAKRKGDGKRKGSKK